MRVLFDTNVVLDVLLAREPHALPAARLFAAVVDGVLEGVLCATSVTTLDYLASKAASARVAHDLLDVALGIFEIAPVNGAVLHQALGGRGPDFEDSVIAAAAAAADVDAIVTRDPAGYRYAAMPVMSPEELIAVIHATRDHVEIVSI
ncbi:MAG: PIN domain-containing protein [Coriobacteriia bacterium]|nr:PIN domain-containing protein [Coriobacteriia bacterium]